MKKIRKIKLNGTFRYAICNDRGEIQFFLNDAEMAEVWDQAISSGIKIL